ncbi:PAS domain S-box protein [Sulfurimonas sp. CS5]|uniref:PAS domain S-box protein n=1 Tax=Sulfurimonas sp. CS5 TaxID=3391145 RepID=UPI0039EC0A6F
MNEFEQFYKLCDSQAMMVETNLDGDILKVNKNYEEFCAYPQSELIKHGFSLIRHPKIKDSFYKKIWEELKKNGFTINIIYNKSKDNKTIVSRNHIVAWKDESDNIVGYKSMSIDMTYEYHQKLKIKKQSEFFQSILNLIPEMLVVVDNFKNITVNTSLLNFLGFNTLNEFSQKHNSICELFKKGSIYLQKSENCIHEIQMATKKKHYIEIKIDSFSGEEHIFSVNAFSMGESNKVLVLFQDITESLHEKDLLIEAVDNAELELLDTKNDFHSNNERFEYAINSSTDGFWDIDFRTNELYFSTAWKKRLGYEDNEKITYADYTKLIEEKCLPEQINKMLNVLSSEKIKGKTSHAFTIIYKIKTKHGERITIEDSGDILFNEDEDPYRIFGFHRDITRKLQEQQRSIQQSKLASLGEMIGNIAHQWRQPISAINGIVNDLEFEIDLDGLDKIPVSRVKEVNQDITEFTAYLGKTIDDFRNFMKEDKEKKIFDLHLNLLSSIKIAEHSFSQDSITLTKEFFHEKIIIKGYPRELNQVVLNILNNAKDALKENEIKSPIVKIETQSDDENVNIYISDNAGGIPEKIIDKVFDPYFTTKHESIGTGIGLSMSKNIIDNHFNGLLSVSNNKEGAVFRIMIPK